MSLPSIKISPEVGVSIPAIRLRRVVFPEPDGPMSERNSPRGTSSDRFSRGVMVVFPLVKDLVTDLMEIRGFMIFLVSVGCCDPGAVFEISVGRKDDRFAGA